MCLNPPLNIVILISYVYMKTFFKKATLSAALLFVALATQAANHVDSLLDCLHNPKSNYVFVIAHRADWRGAPENSIQSIENAIRMGVDMVEIDIQRTADGQFVLMHDPTLDRTSTGKGRISDHTLDQIKQFRLRSGNSIKTRRAIPTLEEALLACRGRVLVNIDKGGDYIREILPVIKRTGTERQVIIKGKYALDRVKADYGDSKGMLYMPIVDMHDSAAIVRGAEFAKKMHPVAFELCFNTEQQLDPAFVKLVREQGSRVWINTLWDTLCAGHDDENALVEGMDKHWGWVLDHHATMIQTDRPEELINYLKQRGRRTLK